MANRAKAVHYGGPFGGYFVTFIGAAVYFAQQAHGFWEFIFAILKALVWPGFFVYHALTLLHA